MSPRPILLHLLLCLAAAQGEYKTTLEYLNELNFKGEQHQLETEDGYLLTMFRIPKKGGTPILVMHGLLGTSDMWVLMQREYNLVTILADNGYDVWITNQRGNAYSHEHKYLPTDSSKAQYWNFSADEIAEKDLPTTIDYIRSETKRDKLLYLGHSMGTTVFFILCSKLPSYCDRIDAAILMAPVAYPPKQITLPSINVLVQWSHAVAESLRTAHIYEFLGRKQFLVDYAHRSCTYEGIFCSLSLQAIDFNKNNRSLPRPIADYVAATLGGTSVKVFEHMSYILSKTGNFGPLKTPDLSYGLTNNFNRPSNPETYNIDNIRVPVALIWATDDIFIDETAINRLKSKLKNVILNQPIPGPFKHMGYFYDLKNNYDVATNVLNIFNKYDSSQKRFSRWYK